MKREEEFLEALGKSNVGTVITSSGCLVDAFGFHQNGERIGRYVSLLELDSLFKEHDISCRPLNSSREYE